MGKEELLQYIYAKLKANPDERNQVCFAQNDYETIKGCTVDDIIEVNKILFQLKTKVIYNVLD